MNKDKTEVDIAAEARTLISRANAFLKTDVATSTVMSLRDALKRKDQLEIWALSESLRRHLRNHPATVPEKRNQPEVKRIAKQLRSISGK